MPEISGVKSSPCNESGKFPLDESLTALMPMFATGSLSSGRAVLMLIVAPMPPGGVFARLVL